MTMTSSATSLLLLALAIGACAQTPQGLPDLRGGTLRDGRILDAGGHEVGQVAADASRGAKVKLLPDDGLVFAGEMYGEATATLTAETTEPASGYVFETHFVLSRPEGFYAHMLILSPRVAAGQDGAAYRISYRFCMPCRVANNNTGFFLINTGTAAYRKDPLYAVPVAGAPYRLTPGREYIAYILVRDSPDAVTISFYLHDTTVSGDDDRPLFEYRDTSADRIKAEGAPRVRVGTGGLIHPAAPAWFGGMRIYPIADLAAARKSERPTTNLPLQGLVPAPQPQATELPDLFGDNMVLQRGKPIAIWGRGIDGDEVKVAVDGESATAKVEHGRWRATLGALKAGGPYELTVTGRDRTIVVKNVLVGEVWVLGGQSNMSWYLADTTGADTEIPASNFPDMRVFSGWHPAAGEPQFELAGGRWKVVSPALKGAFSAVGYYMAKALHRDLKVPIGLIDTSTPATGIECWLSTAAAERVWGAALHPKPGRFMPGLGDPSCFYNGKVAPIMPFAVAGIVWYQGDGSTPKAGFAYRRYIAALIRDWRHGFAQGDLPFLIVQIPRFEGCSPEMRESDLLAALGENNAGLAVVLDVGEPKNIHPRNKRPMGERLALLARQIAYREKIEGWGPIYRSMTVRGGKAYLSFDHFGGGLVLKGDGGFEVCGADGAYVPAKVALDGDGRLVLWSDRVADPVAVRYAWAPVPEFCLYNKEGLLASPFRTRIEPPGGKESKP